MTESANRRSLRRKTKLQLDATVVGIELTLISIIQGLALGVLVASATRPIVELRFEYWPYILVALISILIFWSRSLVHTLSFIGWPLEFGHTFLYFSATLVEAIAFSQVTQPANWFALNTLYTLTIWWLYAHDLRVVRKHGGDFETPGERALFGDIVRDQQINARIFMPAAVIFHAAAWMLIVMRPALMLQRHWHLLPVLLSIPIGLYYLRGGVLLMRRRGDWIVEGNAQKRIED